MCENNPKRKIKVIYFSPAYRPDDNERILKKLSKIEKSFDGIEVVKIESKERNTQEQLFYKYFDNSKTSQLVRRRAGLPPRRLFRNNNRTIYLRGVIALEEGGQIQWAGNSPSNLLFLDDLSTRGPKAVDDLYTFAEKIQDEENDLLDEFESSKFCNGKLDRNVWIPPSKSLEFKNETSKYIDAILMLPNKLTLVIEAEMELHYDAIGQSLCYEFWYQKKNGTNNTLPTIIFKEARVEFIEASKVLGILLYQVKDEQVTEI